MISTVVFDIGMVLVYFRWRELFAELGFEGEKFEKIAQATVHNPWWNEFDKGGMTIEEIVDKYAESAPEYKEDIAKIYDHKDEFIVLYEYTIPWIKDLKERGYKVYILSNWSEPVYEANKNTHLRFLKEVDGEIMSYRERMIKPDREIYELLCNRFNINPSEAVFLDDNAANVKGAKEFGLHAIHFKNYEQAKEELERYLAE
ncbi:MAG: HAD family phosphatase [Lachnospiraceae bacterium]|nr:HAD family phosphatase [Lachnospiraceae bacterium]